ncbi:MAG: DUF1289 domain-containing protein [Proteobacteria bacterium]|nr:DUF1289 domain-containing protein [Pseudomonadota bacterium]
MCASCERVRQEWASFSNMVYLRRRAILLRISLRRKC